MRVLLYRPIELAALTFTVALLLSLAILGIIQWRDDQRMHTVQRSVEHVFAVQGMGLDLLQILLEDLAGSSPLNRAERLRQVAEELAKMTTSPTVVLAANTSARLAQVRDLLSAPEPLSSAALAAALKPMRQATHEEIGATVRLLDELEQSAAIEFRLANTALLVLPSLIIMIWLLRWRIVRPLQHLTELLSRLANGEFSPVPLRQVDPLLVPLLSNYNQMVSRLEELERAHRSHAASLQAEVHAATQALLQQHYNLARAERLAAVEEVAAGLAHELRNPLAGIHLTLTNLRYDLNDSGVIERLDLVLAELDRITRLLNNLLAQARHVPETPRLVNLARMIKELLALVRCQADPEIALEARVAEDLQCRLPEDRLRQALLNLVLNAIQALQGRAGQVIIAATRQADRLELTVCDDGPGFPEPLLASGVRTFSSGRESGTGLGLAMVNRFARDLGGKLELANRQPHGACATLVLRCGEANG